MRPGKRERAAHLVKMGRLDWTNLSKVSAFADKLAEGGLQMTVCWNGSNYNILHTENEDRLLAGRSVAYRTK